MFPSNIANIPANAERIIRSAARSGRVILFMWGSKVKTSGSATYNGAMATCQGAYLDLYSRDYGLVLSGIYSIGIIAAAQVIMRCEILASMASIADTSRLLFRHCFR